MSTPKKKTPKNRPTAKKLNQTAKKKEAEKKEREPKELTGYFERRNLSKFRKHIVHSSRLSRRMKEDLADPEWDPKCKDGKTTQVSQESLDALCKKELTFLEKELTTDVDFDNDRVEILKAAEKIHPKKTWARLQENIEIFVIAISVAVGFRTYFLQPFRIPTGSMMPTLYGITYEVESGDRWDFSASSTREDDKVRTDLKPWDYLQLPKLKASIRTFLTGKTIEYNKSIRYSGDHILVNKMKYNFVKPDRGDVIVFDTSTIEYHQMPDHKQFYIKRLAGLPGESISVQAPYLVVDGEPLKDDPVFQRVASESSDREYPGYPGYLAPDGSLLKSGPIVIGAEEFLPFGDNARSSLDGRYFGPVHRRHLLGPAAVVYWPFNRFQRVK